MPQEIKIDPLLILPWLQDLIQYEPFDYPFIADYVKSDKKLTYIASLHSTDPQSATFKTIHSCLNNAQIDMILLEGLKYSLGPSPVTITNWALRQEQNTFYEGFETAYTITLANKLGIPFQGCEPDELQIYSSALNYEFSPVDLLFYQFLQQCFQMNESKTQYDIEVLYKTTATSQKENLNLKTTPNLGDFYIWYLNKLGHPFEHKNINEIEIAPYENGILYTQRISSHLCKLRDKFMLKTIESTLNAHNSVLIVCGGSHWSTQRLALQKALGSPIYSKS